MGSISKGFALFFILILAISSLSLLIVKPSNAQVSSPPLTVWQKTYGNSDQIPKIFQTNDGGYLFLGFGWSHQMGHQPTALYKLDSQGNLTWEKGITALDMVQTYDGGYSVLQSTTEGSALVKYNKEDKIEWNQTYPNYSQVYFRYLAKTNDGGYVMAGSNATGAASYEFYGITKGNQLASSIIKTDSQGKIQWTKNFNINGTNNILAFEMSALISTSDGGIALGGTATMNSQDTNYCLVKISSQGNLEWVETYGGEKDENLNSLIQTSDGGYVLAGYSFSYNGVPNYVFIPNDSTVGKTIDRDTGGSQAWLVKADSSGNMVWNGIYDPTGTHSSQDNSYRTTATFVIQTSDEGLAFVGAYRSYEGMWLVKTTFDGLLQWNETFQHILYENGPKGPSGATSVLETTDGGFLVGGFTGIMPAPWDSSYFLVKTASILPPPTPTPTPMPTPAPTIAPLGNQSVDLWLTVVGAVLALITILATAFLLFRRHRRQS